MKKYSIADYLFLTSALLFIAGLGNAGIAALSGNYVDSDKYCFDNIDTSNIACFQDGNIVEIAGDVTFLGTGGLAYAGISVVGNAVESAMTGGGAADQIVIFNTNSPNNNATPDHTNDHITIVKAGDYLIIASATVNSVSGAGSRFEMTVQKNNGDALVDALHVDRNITGGGGVAGSVSMSGIATLAVDDTVEVWLENETNTQNYVVEDITLSIVQIGG